jgi:hypothetical protein
MEVEYGETLPKLTWFAKIEAQYGKTINYAMDGQGDFLIASNGSWLIPKYDRESDLEVTIVWVP